MDEVDHGEPIKSRRELRREREKKKRKSGMLEFLVIMLVAFVLVFGFVRPFVVEAFRIPSESMVPTLEVGDRVLANKFIYRFTEPARGDVVLFDSVEEGSEDTLIKRVAGVEGDEIRVQGGTLFVNGEPQDEPYLNQYVPDQSTPYGPETVPKDHVFVLGDNRGNSGDSRVFGPVPVENIKGEGFLVFWPPTHIGPV
jgi:signal peptidase I